jgi:hypothetical protein
MVLNAVFVFSPPHPTHPMPQSSANERPIVISQKYFDIRKSNLLQEN